MRLSIWRRGFKTGLSASMASTIALGILGAMESRSAFQPVNAISHWIWGDKAASHTGFSFQYTMTGYAIHHASSTFWAMIYEKTQAHYHEGGTQHSTAPAIAWKAINTAALAAYTDYQLTPRRLRPGYEQCLSKPSLFLVYLAFAAGLAQRELQQRRHSSG